MHSPSSKKKARKTGLKKQSHPYRPEDPDILVVPVLLPVVELLLLLLVLPMFPESIPEELLPDPDLLLPELLPEPVVPVPVLLLPELLLLFEDRFLLFFDIVPDWPEMLPD